KAWQWTQSPYAAWASILPEIALLPQPPAPKPPLATRPNTMSVTEIETWLRDPYAIYAKRVLGLKPLDPLDREPDMSDFGRMIHRALQRFAEKFPHALPEDIEGELAKCAVEALRMFADRPSVAAFWQPRLKATIPWLVAQEQVRRADMAQLLAEYTSEM